MVDADDLPIYPIRTVAALTGVDARRLRSWETQYELLQPSRTRGGHRLYSARELRLIRSIRRLVEEEGMSLQGVKAWVAAHPDLVDAAGEPRGQTAGPDTPARPALAPLEKAPERPLSSKAHRGGAVTSGQRR